MSAAGGAARVALLVVSLAATALLLEVALRFVPAALPAGVYALGQRFDEKVQSPVYTGAVIYNKVRRTERHANRAGFLDVEHAEGRAPGVARVAFFGDSYVEAAQVPLEETFFRRLAAAAPERAEVLAFGISGWGTLHGLLAHRGLADRFGLDTVVYVFVENDPGDNLWSIQQAYRTSYMPRPVAELADKAPGFRVRWLEGMQSRPLAAWLRSGYEHSLLLRVVWSRIALLHSYGVGSDRGMDVSMTHKAGAIPNQNDLPQSWPPRYSDEARELGRRLLAAWAQEARAGGRRFAVLYVPRGEAQLDGQIDEAETWKPWLLQTTAELGIPLIDPTPELRAAQAAGQSVYDDHWSPAGHAAIAEALVRAGVLEVAAPQG